MRLVQARYASHFAAFGAHPAQDEDLSCPHTQRLFAKYLKPENDKILQIKRDLEETKVQLKRDIEYVSIPSPSRLPLTPFRSDCYSYAVRNLRIS